MRACAVTGAPYALDDDGKTPVLYTILQGPTFEDADPGNWLLVVTGPDGSELMHERFGHKVPDVGMCSAYGCRKVSATHAIVPSPWAAGAYRLRYVYANDTRITTVITMRLTANP